MGLSTPLELELPYPEALRMPNPTRKGWSGVTLPWMSTGYEMQLTPIHMLTFYNAIANNGRMVKPFFVSSIQRDGVIIEKKNPEVINPAICSKSTIEKIKITIVVIPVLILTTSDLKILDVIIVTKLAAKIFAILLPTSIVLKISLDFSTMKFMTLPRDPPCSIIWRALSIPIDIKTASEEE